MNNLAITLLVVMASILNLAYGEERIELQETTVTGNRELPKITHIVPWQSAQLPDAEQPPLEHLIDDALMPLDRDVFRRHINFYYQLNPDVPPRTKSSSAK
jgi:hypothetical protein